MLQQCFKKIKFMLSNLITMALLFEYIPQFTFNTGRFIIYEDSFLKFFCSVFE